MTTNKIIISLAAIYMSFGLVAGAQTPNSIKIKDTVVSPVNTARVSKKAAEAQSKEQREALKEKAESARTQIQGEQEILKSKAGSASSPQAVESREGLQAERSALKENVKNSESETAKGAVREEFKQKAEQERGAVKASREEFKQKAEQAREEMKVSREEFKNKIEIQKEELKTKREEQKVELKNKLEKIKDERKKAIVEKLYNRFSEVNIKITTQWSNVLARLEELLVKISLRADKAAANGADVSAVSSALERAKIAIVAARDAVIAQASKTYPIAVTSEVELKSAVTQTRDKLNQDLKAVREVIQSARQAVVDALTSLKEVPKVDEASSSETSNLSQ